MSDLDRLYNAYTEWQSFVEFAPQGSAFRASCVQQRDQAWESYLNRGGGRLRLHPGDQEAGRTDHFQPMRQGASGEHVAELQRLLAMPQRWQTGSFGAATTRAVSNWQRRYHVPGERGVVDRAMWSSLLGERGETNDPAEPVRAHHVAAHLAVPHFDMEAVTVVVEPRSHWQLMLDDTPGRTFANTYNLSLMARLVYDDTRLRPFYDALSGSARPRSELTSAALRLPAAHGGNPSLRRPPLLRPAAGPYQGYEDFTFVNTIADTQASAMYNDEHVIIAFRGTQEPTDGLTDGFARPVAWPYASGGSGLEVPTGFFRGFDGVRTRLDAFMTRAVASGPADKPIFVCGHSLGGALAVLAGCYLRDRHPNHPIHIYTIGQPRTSNRAFARHYWYSKQNLRSYHRMANVHDPVPMVPRPDIWRYTTALAVLTWEIPVVGTLTCGIALLTPVLAPPTWDSRHFGTHWTYSVSDDGDPLHGAFPNTSSQIETEEDRDAESLILIDPSTHSSDMYLDYIMTHWSPLGRSGLRNSQPNLSAHERDLFDGAVRRFPLTLH